MGTTEEQIKLIDVWRTGMRLEDVQYDGYQTGFKDGVQNLHNFQCALLKSHNSIELEPKLEEMIIRFLHDTTNMILMQRGDET